MIKNWFAAALVAMLAAGCNGDKGGAAPGELEDRPIRLKAAIIDRSMVDVGVSEGATRASVDGFNNTPIAFGVRKKVGTVITIVHWNAVATIYGNVVFTPQQSFDPAIESYHMVGYNPRSTQFNADKSVVTINLTGQEDLMVSDDKNPDPSVTVTNEVAFFSHKLAQLRFTIVNDPDNPFPMERIRTIAVYADNWLSPLSDEAKVDVTTDVNNVTLSASLASPLGYVMYAYSVDEGIATENAPTGLYISPGTQTDVAKVMFEAGKDIRLYIEWGDETSPLKDYDALLTINNPDNSLPYTIEGRSYLVTLRFNASQGLTINTPQVVGWDPGYNNGTSNITINVR
ncbi:hypothetical protein FACS1894159_05220 [Bacteroidia bacterium]|nr:hypothetical protein FACS1894159_05220 [Bacteroidia bacterium]